MSKGKVVLLNAIHESARLTFVQGNYRVVAASASALKGELHQELRDATVLGIRSSNKVTEAMLAQMPNLLAVGAFCIGTNQIDLAACSKRGIAVFNDQYSSSRSVAELALAFMLNLGRFVCGHNVHMHFGVWEKTADGAYEVRGKKLGIVGYGNIGAQLSVLAENLGMKVCFYDVADKLALGNAHKCASLEELLAESDFVSMHIDGRGTNKKVISEREFALMKKGAFFVNVSRGSVVDETALVDAIRRGKLGGAALDVFETEPSSSPEFFTSPLQKWPNIIMTPHIGGSTEEAQENIGRFVAEKLRAYLESGLTSLSVNMPQVAMRGATQHHRITHLHRNVPGVLANINAIFAGSGINIESQRLQTAADLGYAVMDLNKPCDTALIEALKMIPETIRLREISL